MRELWTLAKKHESLIMAQQKLLWKKKVSKAEAARPNASLAFEGGPNVTRETSELFSVAYWIFQAYRFVSNVFDSTIKQGCFAQDCSDIA